MIRSLCTLLLVLAAPLGAVDDPLEQVARPHVHAKRAAQNSPYGYTPSQITQAYGFEHITSKGAGQTIAIIDAYGSPTIQADLDKFCTQFSLPKTTVVIAHPNGVPTSTDAGWALETSLDVEWAHAIAPSATILLVVAKNNTLSSLLNAVDYAVAHGAKQVSMSWGANEFSSQASYDTHFNIAGVSFTASSGDSGAGVFWPAVSTYVTGVGGTSLALTSAGQVLSETAWSGSGGGTSSYTAEPAYQTPFQSSRKRMVPDVSYSADPAKGFCIYTSTPYGGQSGWFSVGGTSAGAPQWAALFALINSARSSPIANTDSLLYSMGSTAAPWLYYKDVTSGSNGRYVAKKGYDEVTGLGSPVPNNILAWLINKK